MDKNALFLIFIGLVVTSEMHAGYNEIAGLTGHHLEVQSGLYYARARYYDPETGVFVSRDPLGVRFGNNVYGYCGQNPINFVDSTGLFFTPETVIDAASLGTGYVSYLNNVDEGNWGWAAVDALGVLYDGVAMAVPFLPGGGWSR